MDAGTPGEAEEHFPWLGSAAAERDRLLLLLATIQDGLMVSDASGRVIRVNDRFLDIVGRGRSEVLGQVPPYPWWPSEGVEEMIAASRRLARGGQGEWERRFVRPSGREVFVIVHAAGLPGGGSIATVKDISERVRTEREREAVARIARLVAKGGDVLALLQLIAEEARGLLEADSCVVMAYGDPVEGGRWADLVGRAGMVREFGVARLHTRPFATILRADPTAREGPAGWVEVELEDGRRERVAHDRYAHVGLVVDGRVWGSMTVDGDRVAGRLDLLDRLGELAALAISSAAAREELARQALTDPLTELLNQRAFQDRLAQETAGAGRHGSPLSLCLIDLDCFKRVNDAHGHLRGDEVLREFAGRLSGRAREEDTIARIGGEEFAWLMPRAGLAAATAAAMRAAEEISAAPFDEVGAVTLSAGVAEWHAGEGTRDLYRRADQALYRAKAAGRDRVIAAT